MLRRSTLHLAVAVLAVLASAVAASGAAADAISIELPSSSVRAGDTLAVHVTPGAPTDGFTFHEASVFVMRPGLPCPHGGAYPAWDEQLGDTVGTGPFRQGDPPEDVGIAIPEDARTGFTVVCTYVWELAGALTGDPLPGPSRNVHVLEAGSAGSTGGDGSSPGTGGLASRRCSIASSASGGILVLRVRCGARVRGPIHLRARCVPRRGRAIVTRRTVHLPDHAGTAWVRRPRHGRCRITVRDRRGMVGRRTVAVG